MQESRIARCIGRSCLINANPAGVDATLVGDVRAWSVVDQGRLQSQMRGQRPPEGM
jgi:hypothetical protein